jgi:hypothetical protein
LKNKKKLCFTAGKDCRQRNIAGNHTNVIEGLTNQSKEAEKSNTEPKTNILIQTALSTHK